MPAELAEIQTERKQFLELRLGQAWAWDLDSGEKWKAGDAFS